MFDALLGSETLNASACIGQVPACLHPQDVRGINRVLADDGLYANNGISVLPDAKAPMSIVEKLISYSDSRIV